MSDVSKPDTPKCPLDLSQYQVLVNNVSPVGSCPWALIQVYAGVKVHRSGWNAPKEHLRLDYESGTGSDKGNPYIEKSDKDGVWGTWQPTKEDLVACDWKLLTAEDNKPKPVDCMLSFTLELGAGKDMEGPAWGYLNEDVDGPAWGYLNAGETSHYKGPAFGTLTTVQNNVGIANISMFYFRDNGQMMFGVIPAQDNPLQARELFTKTLYVTVDNTTYNLGGNPSAGGIDAQLAAALPRHMAGNPSAGDIDNNFSDYFSNDTRKLGAILKETGKTKHFCLTWK
ncbi:Thoeris anti-defense Tad2 family protein [Xenorhabdus kozodoii]|uniref:Uncharacterized protein n=1 Tax=Xenorhabdus kozodoii TaxID=351676 RepID=A0A2D0LH06_9GAMM|nr:MW1434 family type I TA system toxin [Xenorhabdus kozodoii]PHM74903.1 hypothetical protein Xkoz_00434 [Xenorhabdus kozodoii]